MSLTQTTCPYCGVGCGVLASADGTIKGDPKHPANFGRLCSKGAALGETIDLKGRLLHPQVDGVRADWKTALSRVAGAFSQAVQEHGPDSVAFYVSGQLLTEDYYLANKLMKGFIGSANIDTNSRLCMASSVAGHKRAFGTDTVPGTYADLEEADLVVLVGSNLAWCHPVLHQRIAAAKAARPSMKVVNVDPRRTATTELADMHLSVAPDGDAALFNGLLSHLIAAGEVDEEYVRAHVNGFDAAAATAARSDPAQTGLGAAELAAFYRLWAGTRRVVTVYSQGVNQSASGTDKVNAILNCHLATGRIGTPGAGPFSVTGQPNAMGGREVGGLANMLANHLDLENAAHRETVQTFWNAPTVADHAGLKAVDLFEACAKGKIKALWVMSTNPAVSMPDADGVAAAIGNVPFVAVSDIMARTDTGDLADVLLPAAGWGEKDGTVTNSERRISRQRAFLPVPGEAHADWRIIADVAAYMGFGASFEYDTAADVFAEYVALDAAARGHGRDLDLSIFADVDYARMVPTQWPRNDQRFFADGHFYHPDGKARMVAVVASTKTERAGLTLNTGRNRDQWHTMTRTGKAPKLGAHLAEPYVELHPADAVRAGVQAGDLMQLRSLYGAAILRVLISDKVSEGQPFAPMHWTRQTARGGTVNSLVAPVTDPMSGQPALKDARVSMERYAADWYGYIAASVPLEAHARYAAVARTGTGWQAELAGDGDLPDWESSVRQMTGLTDAEASVQEDVTAGTVRIALYQGETLAALFFAAREPVVLSRAAAIAHVGSVVTPLTALAGRLAAGQPDPGATVCACFNVGRGTLLAAVADGASTVEALGAVTCAGTNCGSCKPELTALLIPSVLPVAAE